jgi:putative spermidine/putrescine transport system ATP-binding protein
VVVLGDTLPLVAPFTGTGTAVTALVRPEAVTVGPAPDGNGTVLTSSFLGPTSRVTVAVGSSLVVAQVASGLVPSLTPGTRVALRLAPVPVALDL